jgi:hypothetical protein
MKRLPLLLTTCVFVFALSGCDLMNYIWQHVVGHGYNQVTMDSIQGAEGSMSAASLGVGSFGQNTVVIYKTRHGYYGKLAIVSWSSSSLEIQFTTYDTNGQVLVSRGPLAVGAGENCDLESADTGASASTANFLWTGNALVPQGSPSAKFYILP